MDAAELKGWLASVERLTPAQKADLIRVLSTRDDRSVVENLVESRLAQLPGCPHCAGVRVVRSGCASGLQRYKCKACQRTFNALSKTPLARLRKKAKWLQQEDVLARGLIVRLASAELGVARSTAFRWRHRFLQLAQPVKALVLTGVVEADETFFLRSSKGQLPGRAPRKRGGRASREGRGEDLMPILVARDRSGATADFLLEAVSKKCLSERSGPVCLNSFPRFISGVRAGCRRCRVVHGGGRRLRRTGRRGGQLGAHQRSHLMRPGPVLAGWRSSARRA